MLRKAAAGSVFLVGLLFLAGIATAQICDPESVPLAIAKQGQGLTLKIKGFLACLPAPSDSSWFSFDNGVPVFKLVEPLPLNPSVSSAIDSAATVIDVGIYVLGFRNPDMVGWLNSAVAAGSKAILPFPPGKDGRSYFAVVPPGPIAVGHNPCPPCPCPINCPGIPYFPWHSSLIK